MEDLKEVLLRNLDTEDLWEELADRHREGECIKEYMPDYLLDVAKEEFETHLGDETNDTIIEEVQERGIDIFDIYDDDDIINSIFNCEGIAQIEFVQKRIQDIRDSLVNYSYMKTA